MHHNKPKLPKIAYFPEALPPGPPPELCPWTPPGGLKKRPLELPADLAKIVPRIRTPWVLDRAGYARGFLFTVITCVDQAELTFSTECKYHHDR